MIIFEAQKHSSIHQPHHSHHIHICKPFHLTLFVEKFLKPFFLGGGGHTPGLTAVLWWHRWEVHRRISKARLLACTNLIISIVICDKFPCGRV